MLTTLNSSWTKFWTGGRLTLKHIGFSIAIAVLVYLLFTLFRKSLPAPEVLSPFAYLLAFGALLRAYLRLDLSKDTRLHFLVLALCGLAFLDEISYGVEPGFVKPIYVEKYNVYIYDLHNLIGLVVELVQIFLRDKHWNSDLFGRFTQIDSFAIGLSLAYVFSLRRNPKAKNFAFRILSQLTAFLFFAGLLSIFSLASLPTDPKNAWIFTYSRSRVAMMAGIFVFSILPMLILAYLRNREDRARSLYSRLDALIPSKKALRRLTQIAVIGILAALIYQFSTPFVLYPDQKTIIERINPAVAWLLFGSVLLLTAVQAWKGKLTRPLQAYTEPIRIYVENNPVLIYALAAILLVVVAQVNDKGWLLIGELLAFPDSGVLDWGWWTEEVFEFTAALEFYAASLFYRKLN